MKKLVHSVILFAFLISYPLFSLSFDVNEIRLPDIVRKYEVLDLNGDSLKEIVVFSETKNKKPRIHILWQTSEGFLPRNVQTFLPDSRAILCDFGDVAGDEKMEFIMLTSSGVICFEQKDNRFDLNAKEVLKIRSVFRLRQRKSLPYWNFVRDVTSNGKDEIFIPQFSRFLIFALEDSTWNSIGKLALPTTAGINSFRNLSVDYTIKKIFISDCNQDGLTDVLAKEDDKFFLFLQRENNVFPDKADATFDMKFKPVEENYPEETNIIAIKDINSDGILDLLANKTGARENLLNPQSQIQIYLGKKQSSQLWSLTPDQIIVSSGVQFDEQLVDLNGDGKLDLAIPSVKLGLMRIIKILLTKSVTVNTRIYQMNANDKYPDQPNATKNFTIKFNFNIGNNSAGAEGMVPVFNVSGDFNGDGLRDLVTTIDQRNLQFYYGKKKQIFSSTFDDKFTVTLPKNGNRVKIYDLNGNNKSDIILTYQKQDDKTGEMLKLVRILLN